MRGDLWEVRNAQHLESTAERTKTRADNVGDPPADPGIHFIEDQGLAGCIGCGERLQGQHDTRELAARDDAGQRPQVLAGVRRNEELRFIDAALAPAVGRELAFVEADLEPRARHRELREQRFEPPGEVGRRATTPARQLSREIEESRCCRAQLLLEIGRTLPCAGEQLAFAGEGPALLDHVVQRRPVFPLQPLEQRQSILDLLQARGGCVHAIGVMPEKVREILQL